MPRAFLVRLPPGRVLLLAAGRLHAADDPPPEGEVANLCFGGPEFDVLYATCGDRVHRRKAKTRGAPAYQAPIKPTTPRL